MLAKLALPYEGTELTNPWRLVCFLWSTGSYWRVSKSWTDVVIQLAAALKWSMFLRLHAAEGVVLVVCWIRIGTVKGISLSAITYSRKNVRLLEWRMHFFSFFLCIASYYIVVFFRENGSVCIVKHHKLKLQLKWPVEKRTETETNSKTETATETGIWSSKSDWNDPDYKLRNWNITGSWKFRICCGGDDVWYQINYLKSW